MALGSLNSIALSEFAEDIRRSLSKPGQREIPSKYLYDPIGTALFEVITLLPEYGLTRADERLLERHAGEILDRLAAPLAVTELGSGNGKKAKLLLQVLSLRQPVHYFPIEISASALRYCQVELSPLNNISMVGLEKPYLEGLGEAARQRREGETLLVLFLGSTIGNFERPAEEEFLRFIRKRLQPGDGLLLAADLIKPLENMFPAYDDPIGVTAAFNLNLLARINRELGGDFNLERFTHEARYDATKNRIEMHLRSLRRQTVHIREAHLTFELNEGETIWTEACHKFSPEELPLMASRTGFSSIGQWVDPLWPFSENLWIAV